MTRTRLTDKLLTDEQREAMLAHGRARAAGQAIDPQPVVRLFTPDTHAVWMLTDLDPSDEDNAYGLCDVGTGFPMLGHIRISVLESIVGPRKKPVARDLYFKPQRTLSEYLALAVENGSVID